MNSLKVTPEDLLAGADTAFDLVIPKEIMAPGGDSRAVTVRIAPLTIGVFQLILKAARTDSSLIPLLMVKESLIEPAMTLEQIKRLPLGMVTFLMGHIREISGLSEKKKFHDLRSSSLARDAFRLARAFGWTPREIMALTMAQVRLFLEFLDEERLNG